MNELFDPELKAWRAHGIVMSRMRDAREDRETMEENASVQQEKIVDEDNKQRSDHVEYV